MQRTRSASVSFAFSSVRNHAAELCVALVLSEVDVQPRTVRLHSWIGFRNSSHSECCMVAEVKSEMRGPQGFHRWKASCAGLEQRNCLSTNHTGTRAELTMLHGYVLACTGGCMNAELNACEYVSTETTTSPASFDSLQQATKMNLSDRDQLTFRIV